MNERSCLVMQYMPSWASNIQEQASNPFQIPLEILHCIISDVVFLLDPHNHPCFSNILQALSNPKPLNLCSSSVNCFSSQNFTNLLLIVSKKFISIGDAGWDESVAVLGYESGEMRDAGGNRLTVMPVVVRKWLLATGEAIDGGNRSTVMPVVVRKWLLATGEAIDGGNRSTVMPVLFQTSWKQLEEGMQNSVPIEIALKIASSLQASDPAIVFHFTFYMINFFFLTDVVQQFSCTESIDVGQYLSAIEGMCLKELGFKDVQMFFFKPNLSVLINLMGLHYCISWLGVPTAYVGEALDSCKISEREVCVQRLKIPRGFCGFGYICRTFSLADIASGNEDTVRGLLRRRVPITEPYRVQISVVKPDTPRSANFPPL
ncbi:hypothetical protein RHMOL_Rhmol04G0350000 [Rhododendron molle]|uniref:Uncharacterized protein n=1 Tax=Rhododendron molle TaxID=49168 RepID=A0ACC0P946_RHOML|nr:hypothetical protein RHMOL_Rhmol04G0350000 [Rhododendron molle]